MDQSNLSEHLHTSFSIQIQRSSQGHTICINSHWPINPKVQPVPPTLSCKSPGQAEIWKFLILNATKDDVDECFLHVFFAREHQGSQKEIARQ